MEINKKLCVCFYLTAFIFIVLFVTSCSDIKRNETHKDVALSNIEKGKELAMVHCQSCHMLPEPSWVDTKTWEHGILPHMGPLLGIFHYNNKSYPYGRFDANLSPGYYPAKPLVTDEEWQHILDYYIATSPDSVTTNQKRVRAIQNQLPLFEAVIPAYTYPDPATCFVKIDTSDPVRKIVISDAFKEVIYCFNKDMVITDSVKTKGAVVNIELQKREWLACNIGELNPNNGKYGSAQHIAIKSKSIHRDSTVVIFKDLQRPVQITAADLNNDGRQDYLSCGFGYFEGALSWMEGKGDGNYIQHILRPLPGAIKAYIDDYNKDGLKDIWVLFAQAEEGIFLYTNKGNGQFAEEQVLRFPPINGSSYFELDDFNKDGYPDIVYTCGDNADYSTVLKLFHGIYIYLNDGKNHFEKKYFFPVNGCYKAVAADYDKDGDLDIAAIAYFPDYQRQPEEGFVYLENKGDFDFFPYSLPATQTGRWISMDAGDFDNDGWTDLVLGNFSVAPSFTKSAIDWKHAPPFMILKNAGKKNVQN